MDERFFVIQRTLWDLSIPPTYLGAHYLAYAELLVLEDRDRLVMVTKWLYPEIAAHYHTSWKAVERDIRTVIAGFWSCGGRERLAQVTGTKLESRPSPTGIIQILARYFLCQPAEFWNSPVLFQSK